MYAPKDTFQTVALQDILENTSQKTRIVITGTQRRFVTDFLLQTLPEAGKIIDFYLTDEPDASYRAHITGSDFAIIKSPDDAAAHFSPTILMITGSLGEQNIENYAKLIKGITAGGVLIYDEDIAVAAMGADSGTFFRQITYSVPPFRPYGEGILLETDFGQIPLNVTPDLAKTMEGIRLLCGLIGLHGEDFYEAALQWPGL